MLNPLYMETNILCKLHSRMYNLSLLTSSCHIIASAGNHNAASYEFQGENQIMSLHIEGKFLEFQRHIISFRETHCNFDKALLKSRAPSLAVHDALRKLLSMGCTKRRRLHECVIKIQTIVCHSSYSQKL